MFKVVLILSFYVQIFCGVSSQSTSLISPRDSGGGWGWGSNNTGLQSFFDIALTALAFLSFGIFLLNLLMNALLFTSGVQTGLTSTGPIITMTAPTATGGAGTATGGGGAAAGAFYRSRGKRSLLNLDVESTVAANILAETVIKSIDAMISKHECLPMVFCEGNKKAGVIGHGFQYLMPLFSFSSSYVGEKLGLHDCFPDHLDAILHGVDESNCQSYFPSC